LTATPIRYAGFWRRLLATVIDNILLIPLLGFLGASVFGSSQDLALASEPLAVGQVQAALAQQVLPLFVGLLLVVFFWVRFLGTPGKLLLRCRVVDAASGKALSVTQSVARYLGYVLCVLTLGVGFVWIAWDARKQGWHDKLAGSVVIMSGREAMR
jgi:uncharacterized RDD family membrane protein YckC